VAVAPQLIPQPRIDTFVRDAATGAERRRTEYSGTVWFGGPPDTGGRIVGFVSTFLRDATPVFLPDSLPYRRDALSDALVSCTAAVQGSTAETNFVTAAGAAWADDPRGGDLAWLQLTLDVYGKEPLGVAYRVVALCDPEAVATGTVSD
jgi:hypothetical protein